MQDSKEELYSRGALAKMVDISTDTLRYYAEIGLFMPRKISDETKYRYYTADQAVDLARIIELKSYGFSLNEIKDVIKQGDKALTDAYLNRYWALEDEKKKIQNAIDLLSEKIKEKMEGSNMNKKILLADDSAFMRMMCKDILTKNGYEIVGEASDGNEAFDLYKSLKPEAVVLNIEMPNLNGLDALRLIKEHDKNANIIMLSAACHAHTVINAMKAGAKYFIGKPFQTAGLVDGLKSLFSQFGTIHKETAEEMLAKIEDRILPQTEIDLIVKALYSDGNLKWQPVFPKTDKGENSLVIGDNFNQYEPQEGYAEFLVTSKPVPTPDKEMAAMAQSVAEFMLKNDIVGVMVRNPIKDQALPINTIKTKYVPNKDNIYQTEDSAEPNLLSTGEVNALLSNLLKNISEVTDRLDKLEENQEKFPL